jgi:hypothetical protein
MVIPASLSLKISHEKTSIFKLKIFVDTRNTITSNSLDFLSRDCKSNKHHECIGRWDGLGLEIYCYCSCHNNKKGESIVEVEVTTNTPRIMQPHTHTVADEVTDRKNYHSEYDKLCADTILPLSYDFGQRFSRKRNSRLVKSIRANHANLSIIAEYEENDLLNHYCPSHDVKLS